MTGERENLENQVQCLDLLLASGVNFVNFVLQAYFLLRSSCIRPSRLRVGHSSLKDATQDLMRSGQTLTPI